MGKMLADILFLERLGYELTRPVLPKSAALDYIPSQYICEFIKKTGFHGVLYSCSVSEGINLALFEPENAIGGSVRIYDLDKVDVSVSKKISLHSLRLSPIGADGIMPNMLNLNPIRSYG